MEKEHTPAEIRPNRTTYRFTKHDVCEALAQWLARHGESVPIGKAFLDHGSYMRPESWALTLGIDHDDPPPAQQDVDDD